MTRSLGWLMAGHLATIFVGLATSILIAQAGADELGRWRFAQALVTYLLVGTDAGLTLLSVREVARRPGDVDRYAGPVLFIRLVLAIVAIAAVVMVLDPTSDEAGWFYLAMFCTIVPASLSLLHIAQGIQRIRTYALARFVGGAVAGSIGLVGYVLTGNLVVLVLPLIGIGLMVDLALAIYLRKAAGLTLHFGTPRLWIALVVPALPFLIGAVAVQLISNADAVIIGAVHGEAELGIYAAAYVLAGQLLFLSGPIASVIYPRLSMLHERGTGFRRATREVSGVLGLFAVPACVGAALLAPSLIDMIFGPEYERSVLLLTVLMGMPLIGFYNVAMSQTLNAARSQRTVATVAVIAASVSVALNLAFVPTVGLIAAAVIAVITETATAVAYTRAVRQLTGLAPLRAYFETWDAVVVMAVVILALGAVDVGLPLTVLTAAAAYGGVVLARRPGSLITISRLIGR